MTGEDTIGWRSDRRREGSDPWDVVVFEAGTEGYHTFRIPAIVRTKASTLLAFAEGRRRGAGDSGEIDLVVRRSEDGGATWGPLQVVHADPPHTVGNPAPVMDPRTGAIALVHVRTAGWASEDRILRGVVSDADGRRVFVQRSVDDGRTWTSPHEITAQVKRRDWRWYATGPGHGIALRHGPFAGRLIVPADHSGPRRRGGESRGAPRAIARANGGGHAYGGHVLFSDDGGLSWHLGAVQPGDETVEPNESTAAELPDGRIYFSARNQSERGPTRVYAVSTSGGENFDEPYRPLTGLVTPVVQGSVLALDDLLVYSGPGDSVHRRAMTVRTSTDGGLTWRRVLATSHGPAAYSDLVDLDGRVGLLYETGDSGPYERICFTVADVRSPVHAF